MNHRIDILRSAAAAAALALALSCGGGGGGGGDAQPPTIHVVGYEANGQNISTATYWSDRNPTKSLGDGARASNSYAIFVEGSDVYVAGVQYDETSAKPRLWKNGAPHQELRLSQGMTAGFAVSVFVRGSNTWVAGYEFEPVGGNNYARPVLWKNGSPQRLLPIGPVGDDIIDEGYGRAESVFVAPNGDEYVSGQCAAPVEGYVYASPATVWVNGRPNHLAGSLSGFVASVTMSNNRVFAAGGEWDDDTADVAINGGNGYSARLWELTPGQNGSLVSTKNIGETSMAASEAYSVCVSGNDVYVAFDEVDPSNGYWVAKYSKNGTSYRRLGAASARSEAACISVHGGDVYVSGGEYDQAQGRWVAKYWINDGQHAVTPGEGRSVAYGIVVK